MAMTPARSSISIPHGFSYAARCTVGRRASVARIHRVQVRSKWLTTLVHPLGVWNPAFQSILLNLQVFASQREDKDPDEEAARKMQVDQLGVQREPLVAQQDIEEDKDAVRTLQMAQLALLREMRALRGSQEQQLIVLSELLAAVREVLDVLRDQRGMQLPAGKAPGGGLKGACTTPPRATKAPHRPAPPPHGPSATSEDAEPDFLGSFFEHPFFRQGAVRGRLLLSIGLFFFVLGAIVDFDEVGATCSLHALHGRPCIVC